METNLYLIRHAESVGNINGRFNGWTDHPLTEKGIRQAELLKRFLEGKNIGTVVSSPLLRTRQTLEISLPHLNGKVHWDGRLKEINGGLWEGAKWNDLRIRWEKEYLLWETFPSRMTMPEGESIHEMFVRSAQAIDEILAEHPGENIGVFTHGTVLRALIAHLVHRDIEALNHIPWHENASVTYIRSVPEKNMLIYEGESSFLNDETATIRNAWWNKRKP